MPTIGNYTYDELTIGQSASYAKRIEERDIVLFAAVSGDCNPVHLDAQYAAGTRFGERIAHGMLTGAVISAALAMTLPGPGSVYLSQTLEFLRPVKLGDTVTVELTVSAKDAARQSITLACSARNQDGKRVAQGSAVVLAPPVKLDTALPELPDVRVAGLD